MTALASLRCDVGTVRAASGNGVATMLSSEASMAWALLDQTGVERRGEAAIPDGAGRIQGRPHHDGQQSGLDGVGAKEVTTTTRATATGVDTIDDNYGGGDDNYPRVMGEDDRRRRGEGRGWDRQK
jgi:hypothetical protein